MTSPTTKDREERGAGPSGLVLVLVFLALATGILVAGYQNYRQYRINLRSEVERQLRLIGELKSQDLSHWRQERLGNAQTIFENAAFSALVKHFLETPDDPGARRTLQAWLTKLQSSYEYERIFLIDTAATIRLSAPEETTPVVPHLPADAAAALQAGRIEFLDFRRDSADGTIHLAILVPILDVANDRRPLGLLALRIDPYRFLYPFVQSWPTPSQTAETLLVRREGNDSLFLNELRFRKNTALSLRIPLNKTDTPAVQAALGRVGTFTGIDYRGVPVVADVRPVPSSPWFLVSRMDVAEVYAPLDERLWLTLLLMAALIGTAATGIGLIWRQQRLHLLHQRMAASERLRQSELRYRRLFETAKDGILILDAETGAVIDVNPFLAELLGYTHDYFLDKKVWELGFLKDIVANQDNFAELQDKEYIRYDDRPLEASDGRRIDVEFVSNVYLVGNRKVIQCNIRDTTERRKATLELQATTKELQRRNDDLMRFTYAVSHDLKSPLVTIKAFLGFLDKDTRKGDAAAMDKDLGFIHRAAEKMSRLLDELLDLSRIGRTVSLPVEAPLGEIVNDALDLVAGQIAERGVQVAVSGEATVLRGDRVRLVEVFQNLVDNAVKFMGDQTAPLVEIGVDRVGEERVFFVRDNGMGIDPRHQSKLFGLFEKLDPGAEGTGIGLALVKRIVEVHGGRIWAESEGEGRGSIFRFTLAGTREPESAP